MSARSFLAALQLADSALPIGRFVHSNGLEAWLHAHDSSGPLPLCGLVESVVCSGVAELDGAMVAHAHRASSLSTLEILDQRLTARKLAPPARHASHACGRQLAALAPTLAPDDGLVNELAEQVSVRRTDGNLAVVSGCLARACDLTVSEAVLIELRGAATALLSAAVRLGATTPSRAQGILTALHPAMERAAEAALVCEVGGTHASVPELEAYTLVHRRSDARLFST